MIRGRKVELRAFEASDAEAVHRFKNDPAITEGLYDAVFPQSMIQVSEWVRHASSMAPEQADYRFAIVSDDGKTVGFAGIYQIDWKAGNGEVGIAIGDADYQGKGYGTDALVTVTRFAFEEMGLRRLWTRVLASNERSQKLFEKCGYTREGLLREHHFRHGRMQDVVLFGRLADDPAPAE